MNGITVIAFCKIGTLRQLDAFWWFLLTAWMMFYWFCSYSWTPSSRVGKKLKPVIAILYSSLPDYCSRKKKLSTILLGMFFLHFKPKRSSLKTFRLLFCCGSSIVNTYDWPMLGQSIKLRWLLLSLYSCACLWATLILLKCLSNVRWRSIS